LAKDVDERHQMLDALRADRPVFRDEASRSFILSRHADARALLGDNSQWRDADKAEPEALVHNFKPRDRTGEPNTAIGWLDEPDHARIRGPIQQALYRRVAALRPTVEAIVEARMQALAGRGAFDVVADYAMPIPIEVIGRVLGVSVADQAQFRAWSEAAIGLFSPDPAAAGPAKAAADAIMDYLAAVMAERRRAPADDLISDLLAGQAASGLSDTAIRVNCMNLLLGGNVTTADLIASAVWLLLSHPDELAKLRADPGLITAAVEETLRFEPPTEGTQRIASRDLTIQGCPVRQGQVVAVLINAANRDPAVFTDPHRFDITRKGPGHLAFGGGAHICIGAPLARLEAQVAVGALMAARPRLRLADPSAAPQWRNLPFFRGLASLPVLA
jgi:cytochrome P450